MTVSPAPVSSAEYYSHDGYYTLDEGPSEWSGAGAQKLGLEGQVKADQFARIIDGILPDGSALARGADGTRNRGTDLTFSAPKSVSLVGHMPITKAAYRSPIPRKSCCPIGLSLSKKLRWSRRCRRSC